MTPLFVAVDITLTVKLNVKLAVVLKYACLAAYLNLKQVVLTIMYSSFDRENVIHADLKPENILLEEGISK